jgi:hypothetical protein
MPTTEQRRVTHGSKYTNYVIMPQNYNFNTKGAVAYKQTYFQNLLC